MQRILVGFVFLLGTSALAQDTSHADTSSPENNQETLAANDLGQNGWNDATGDLRRGEKIRVVTVAHLNRRSTCRVISASEQQLVCGGGLTVKQRIYKRDEVAALIWRAVHTAFPWIAGFLAGGGGLITGACFLAPLTLGAAIPVAILGGLSITISGAFAMSDDGYQPEQFGYQRPGINLSSVKLK